MVDWNITKIVYKIEIEIEISYIRFGNQFNRYEFDYHLLIIVHTFSNELIMIIEFIYYEIEIEYSEIFNER